MRLSTDLPTTLAQYDALPGDDSHKLASNVSRDADAQFMTEVARTDAERYHRLRRSMERAAGRVRQREQHPERHYRKCAFCGRRFLAKRPNNSLCSRACRNRAYQHSRKSQLRQISITTALNTA